MNHWEATFVFTLFFIITAPRRCESALSYFTSDVNDTSNSSTHSSHYSASISLNVPLTYSEERLTSAREIEANNAERLKKGNDHPPGADTDPYGVIVYNSLDQVPTARLLWQASKMQTCYAFKDGTTRCWAAYVCGHRCEPVLLAINSFCRQKEPESCREMSSRQRTTHNGCGKLRKWIRCRKPRKFKRCYARVCFRRRRLGIGPKPMSYEDPLSVSIVRYHRSPPKHDFFAKRL